MQDAAGKKGRFGLLDSSGQRFGKLVVIARGQDYISPRGLHQPCWNCRCDCGNSTAVTGTRLRSGKTRSCGCMQGKGRFVDHAGRRYGRLVVISRGPNGKRKQTRWRCKCDCGKDVLVTASSLRSGSSMSCGCLVRYVAEARCGTNSARWKGGRSNRGGYISVVHGSGSRRRFIDEHRLVMETMLGRPLLPTELVHHKNGDRADNRPDNLELWTKGHPPGHRVEDIVRFSLETIARYPDVAKRIAEENKS